MSISACITSISGPVLLPEERAFLREAKPWGVILMGRSCESKVQVTALVAEIHEALGREALVFIDQEGGRVARLKAPLDIAEGRVLNPKPRPHDRPAS